jgi:hypothetical protein
VNHVLDTFESRRRHRAAIKIPTIYQSGFVYICPRCHWQSRPMRWYEGAERYGDEHALVCKPTERTT